MTAQHRRALRALIVGDGETRIDSDDAADRILRAGWAPRPEPGSDSPGVAAIAAERRRQIEAEGWTPDHDDEHRNGQMARAAACYAVNAAAHEDLRGRAKFLPMMDGFLSKLWPWEWSWWKPTDRRRDLVKAGALIAAEIDRLDRVALYPEEQSNG